MHIFHSTCPFHFNYLIVGEAKGEAPPIYTDQPVNCQALILSKAFRIDLTFPSFTLTLLAHKQAGGLLVRNPP